MKSRTSFFNFTVFKKDITRFAPLWGLYTLCMVMGTMLLAQGAGNGYVLQQDLAALPQAMNAINFIYAAIAAQLLFGDLYTSRMCNALHSLPLRRECWFGTHVVSGLLFSIVPTLLGMLTAAGLDIASNSMVTNSWQLPWLNFAAMNLQYLFYFGLAVFCVMCVGNRFAQAVVYGIVNFASVITFWLVDTLFTPMFYGLQTADEPFVFFSPVVHASGANTGYIDLNYHFNENHERIGAWFDLIPGMWRYIAICAMLGIALLITALLLYRRRKLESAGDFAAVKALEPVFMVVFPIVSATLVYYFAEEMLGMVGKAYMAVGLVVGYIAGRMLLERTTRVFSKKNIIGFAALAAAFAAVFLAIKADPLGWENWIPKAEEVQYVKVYAGYYAGHMNVTMDTPEKIEKALRVHEIALAERNVYERAVEVNEAYGAIIAEDGSVMEQTVSADEMLAALPEDYISPQDIHLEYHLVDGSVRRRYYVIDARDEAGDILIPYFSNMEMLFSVELELPDHSPETIAAATVEVRVDDGWGITHRIVDKELILQLLQAIEADCKAGTMAQNYNFRAYTDSTNTYGIDFDMGEKSEYISTYTDCENVNAFLMSLGIEHREFIEIVDVEH